MTVAAVLLPTLKDSEPKGEIIIRMPSPLTT